MKISKKKLVSFITAVTALGAVAGALAFYSSTATIDNDLHTEKYGTKTVEEFTPDQLLEPGAEIIKKVGMTNIGSADQIVRISMVENWWRDANGNGKMDDGEAFATIPSSDTSFNDVSSANKATQGDPADGLVTGDHTVIAKKLAASGWTFENGYWYYNDVLKPGLNTGDLLETLKMADNADVGFFITTEYWSTVAVDDATLAAKKSAYESVKSDPSSTQAQIDAAEAELDEAYHWTTEKPDDVTKIRFIKKDTKVKEDAKGYSDALYTLSVITEACQVSADAVKEAWHLTGAPSGTNWGLTF